MVLDFLPNTLSRLSLSTKLLLGIWSLFLILVAFGIHGAPTPELADFWSRQPYTGYVFGPAAALAKKKSLESYSLNQMLMMVPPGIRSDDYFTRFPLALSQLSHNPRFPVVNTNYWNGMNMLVQPIYDVPVWHISALARPGTWGYFFLGAQRGVAWQWWFQIFACFTTLYLLLVVILKGNRKLAAFGSFWFCCSAHVVCMGYWQTYVTFYASLAALAAYWLLESDKRWIQLTCAVLLGLALSGFVMILYPPWQVPLGYLFLLLLAGLAIRDGLWISLKQGTGFKALSIGIAAAVAAIIIGAYLSSSWADLKVMADTVYPGNRRTEGGFLPFWRLFSGAYNVITSFRGYDVRAPAEASGHLNINPTEASSFYLLFPALLAPLALSNRWRKSLGVIGWSLAGYLAAILVFIRVKLPGAIGRVTLLDRTHGTRVVLAVGLASIILCLRALQCARSSQPGERRRLDRAIPVIAALTIVPIIVVSGLFLAAENHSTPSGPEIVLAALAVGAACYCMVAGRARAFCAIVALAVIPIPWMFNPLSTNLDYIYKSELAAKIEELDKQSGSPPLWVCYDDRSRKHMGVLVTVLGGRTVTAIQWPPDMAFWHALDPSRTHEEFYNRFAHVFLRYTDDETVSYSNPTFSNINVSIRADNPVLRQMGAKYILASRESAVEINKNRFPMIYESPSGEFTIFEIP
jgi:hypothetical protein